MSSSIFSGLFPGHAWSLTNFFFSILLLFLNALVFNVWLQKGVKAKNEGGVRQWELLQPKG